jgi:hypothetical protein
MNPKMKFLAILAFIASAQAMSLPPPGSIPPPTPIPPPKPELVLRCPAGTVAKIYSYIPKTGVVTLQCCSSQTPALCNVQQNKVAPPAVDDGKTRTTVTNKIKLSGLSSIHVETNIAAVA